MKTEINNSILSEFIGRLRAIHDEARINVSETGFEIKMIDPANVALISIELSSQSFESFSADESEIGIDLEKLADYISAAGKNDIIKLSIEEGSSKLKVAFDGFEYEVALLDPSTVKQAPRIPNLDLTAQVCVPTKEIYTVIKASEKLEDHICITIDSAKQILSTLSAKETTTLNAEIGMDKLISAPIGDGKAMYSLDYLADIFKSIKNKETTIKLDSDKPIIIESQFDEYSSSSFMLAPRIES